MATTPRARKTPTAIKAVVKEAESTLVLFEYDGEEYSFDSDAMNDVEILESFEDGKVVQPIRKLLGQKQWDKFKESPRTAEDLAEFAEAMFESLGTAPGE